MEQGNFVEPTAAIVSAYVSNNSIQSWDISVLISEVHAALHQTHRGPTAPVLKPKLPAISIKKSVAPNYIVRLGDGKKFNSLKRHVRTYRGLTPQEYREKWLLPGGYPMVAPNYAKVSSMLAKKIGLGQRRGKPPPKHLTTTHGATLPKR